MLLQPGSLPLCQCGRTTHPRHESAWHVWKHLRPLGSRERRGVPVAGHSLAQSCWLSAYVCKGLPPVSDCGTNVVVSTRVPFFPAASGEVMAVCDSGAVSGA